LDETNTVEKARKLYEMRKDLEKKVEGLESGIEDLLETEIEKPEIEEIEAEVPTENVGLLIQVAQKLSQKHQACITLLGEKGAVSASQTGESAAESFAKAFDIN
jgi:hypothetical protein